MSKIRIEKVSITDASTDCIVNAANEQLMGGSGVCGAIFKAAGWNQLQNACNAIGHCDTGSAVITPAFNLKAKYIIHAVGPVWHDGKQKEPQKLYGCYKASLDLAKKNGCHSIAFPLISAGIFGYPKDKAWRKAIQACNDFIQKNPDYDIDILFAVLDGKILQLGLDELERQSKENKQNEQSSEADLLLEKLDGQKLRNGIEAVRTAGKVKWHGGVKKDGVIQMPFPEYPDGVWESLFVMDMDKNYSENYENSCNGVLPSEMNVQQIRTVLTYISRGEHFCDGFLGGYLEDKTLLKLLLRLDDLLIRYCNKNNIPAEWRYQMPVFWYEMDENNTPVLVKGNGEKITITERSDMFDMTVQSQQGWQRSRLYMEYDNVWDATAFGATMSATLAFGPDEEGRCYTFTSCEEADRRMYENLTNDQVTACRKNVDAFYVDRNLQVMWKKVILHPVCLILRKDGSLEPADLKQLNPEILDQFQQHPIRIGDPESYEWIFNQE